MKNIQKAFSITHLHLLSIINTIIEKNDFGTRVRILEAGCGNGKLIHYLHLCLIELFPEKEIEIHGFDVIDHGVQAVGFLEQTRKNLTDLIPNVDWNSRICVINSTQDWGFVSEGYDFVISNQVLEHVNDKEKFFKNIAKSLKDGGYSIHLAPLVNVIHEGHIFIPYAHRFLNYCSLLGYIRFMSMLGIGKYRAQKKATNCSLDEYSERHADYIYFWTNYSSEKETIRFARNNGMRADFRFSLEFYAAKVRTLVGLPNLYRYKYRESTMLDAAIVKLLKYISSVTLVCKKLNTY